VTPRSKTVDRFNIHSGEHNIFSFFVFKKTILVKQLLFNDNYLWQIRSI